MRKVTTALHLSEQLVRDVKPASVGLAVARTTDQPAQHLELIKVLCQSIVCRLKRLERIGWTGDVNLFRILRTGVTTLLLRSALTSSRDTMSHAELLRQAV